MDERDRRIEGLEMLTAEKNERLAELRARVAELEAVHDLFADLQRDYFELQDRVKELEAQLLKEYEIQQAECLSDSSASSASDCDMCGGCILTQRIAKLKGGE